MSVYFDISEFLSSPHRTGIQRVTAELCSHWPDPSDLIPVKITRDARMTRLPENAFGIIRDYFRSPAGETSECLTRIQKIATISETGPHVPLVPGDILICSEVFW